MNFKGPKMRKYIFLIVFIFLNYIPIASAEDWKEIGWWSVGPIDGDDGYSCRMYANYTNLVFKLDYSYKNNDYYLEINSENWKSIEDDKSYTLDIEFDQGKWTLPTTGFSDSLNNVKIYGLFSRQKGSEVKEFVEDFQKSTSIRISFDENEIALLDLKSTYRAVEEIKSCSSRQYSLNNTKDPFANKKQPKQPGKLDPFR